MNALFEFQKFDGNAHLRQVIDSVHARYGMKQNESGVRELTMDEMERLAAAGMPTPKKKEEKNEPV